MWRDIARNLLRRPAAKAAGPPDAGIAALLAARLKDTAHLKLGRSLAILQVSAGGCGGCAMEVQALSGMAYQMERHGLQFVSNPRHADVLLVTGPLTHAMRAAMEDAWTAMPDPKWVVAVGGCAIDGGLFAGSYAVEGGIGAVLPVDIAIPGCPPPPAAILTALLTLIRANR